MQPHSRRRARARAASQGRAWFDARRFLGTGRSHPGETTAIGSRFVAEGGRHFPSLLQALPVVQAYLPKVHCLGPLLRVRNWRQVRSARR